MFQLKSAESGYSGGGNESNDNGTDMHPPPANGSIITMTLKNNHLIVETEVRNVSIISNNLRHCRTHPKNLPIEVQRETFRFMAGELHHGVIF